jgi:hypothetical protein
MSDDDIPEYHELEEEIELSLVISQMETPEEKEEQRVLDSFLQV